MDFGQRNKVVARFKDGNILKGYTHDFFPNKATFHLNADESSGSEDIQEIKLADLKALFFVKSLQGNRDYNEIKEFADAGERRMQGIKIRVEFYDGEVLSGMSLGYNKNKPGFFIIPIDPDSNNERIYVIAAALKSVQVGDLAAEKT
jgi:hypothetical protein